MPRSTADISTRTRRLGYLFAILAITIFALQDGISKHLGSAYPPIFVTMMRFWAFGAFSLVLASRLKGGIAATAKTRSPGLQWLRSAMLAIQIVMAITCFAVIGLARTQAIFAATPLIVTLFSVLLLGERAGLLREAAATLRALMRPDALRRAEPDIAALLEAEGIAMRPGPRPVIAPGVLATLRRAILGMRLVVARYAGPGGSEPATRILCPYGILYGGRGWLVAHVEGLPEMRLWRLDRIVSVDLLERNFPRREDFSLADYAARSFGVFQEAPEDVVLRFAPEAAEDAAGWLFHPTQTQTPEDDGSLTVRFRAGGMRELCWHLFTWGEMVNVLAPDGLRREMREMTEIASRHFGEFADD